MPGGIQHAFVIFPENEIGNENKNFCLIVTNYTIIRI